MLLDESKEDISLYDLRDCCNVIEKCILYVKVDKLSIFDTRNHFAFVKENCCEKVSVFIAVEKSLSENFINFITFDLSFRLTIGAQEINTLNRIEYWK